MSTTHEARTAKHLATITKGTTKGWHTYKVPRVGIVAIHCMPEEAMSWFTGNQCWLRIGGQDSHELELRGSAESVAKQLCRYITAPSKAVAKAAEAIEAKWFSANPMNWTGFDGMRAEEIATWLKLDTDTTFRALDLLAERGLARNEDGRGWFRTSNEI